MWEIETEDFYEGIRSDIEENFDTGNYPKDGGEVVGMMKDEADRKIIEVFSQLHGV